MSTPEKEPMPEEPQSHETFVLGIDKGMIVFIKTFHYATQKEEAQAVLAHVQKKYSGWLISHVGHWKLENVPDGESYQINISL